MWISFNEPKVLEFLLSKGYIYTIRHYPARPPRIRSVKQGRKFLGFKVEIETIQKVASFGVIYAEDVLSGRVSESGFQSLTEWKAAVARQHKDRGELWLLRATKI